MATTYFSGLGTLCLRDDNPTNHIRQQPRKPAREEQNEKSQSEPEGTDTKEIAQAPADTSYDPVGSGSTQNFINFTHQNTSCIGYAYCIRQICSQATLN
jgi:hypothetical protein